MKKILCILLLSVPFLLSCNPYEDEFEEIKKKWEEAKKAKEEAEKKAKEEEEAIESMYEDSKTAKVASRTY